MKGEAGIVGEVRVFFSFLVPLGQIYAECTPVEFCGNELDDGHHTRLL
jgi:hypothetical protein